MKIFEKLGSYNIIESVEHIYPTFIYSSLI